MAIPISFQGRERTIPQRTILSLLYDRGKEHVLVHGAYLSDVLALQVEGLVTHQLIDGVIEVRLSDEHQTHPLARR